MKQWRKVHKMGEDMCNHISDKGLVSRIYKELLQLKNKANERIFKWTKDWNRYLTVKDTQHRLS